MAELVGMPEFLLSHWSTTHGAFVGPFFIH